MVSLRYSGPIASVNAWKQPISGGKGMILTRKYRDFCTAMAVVFVNERIRKGYRTIEEPCFAYVTVSLPAAMDSSNITKPLFDSLQKAWIVVNDRLIRTYTIDRTEKAMPKGTGEIHVVLTPIPRTAVPSAIAGEAEIPGAGGDITLTEGDFFYDDYERRAIRLLRDPNIRQCWEIFLVSLRENIKKRLNPAESGNHIQEGRYAEGRSRIQ